MVHRERVRKGNIENVQFFNLFCSRYPQVEIPDELKDPSPSLEEQGNVTQIVAEPKMPSTNDQKIAENSKAVAVSLQTTTIFEEVPRTMTVENNSATDSSDYVTIDQELEIGKNENKLETI